MYHHRYMIIIIIIIIIIIVIIIIIEVVVLIIFFLLFCIFVLQHSRFSYIISQFIYGSKLVLSQLCFIDTQTDI